MSLDNTADGATTAFPHSTTTSADTREGAIAELQDRFHYSQELRRGLSVWHLTGYGINYMGPIGGALLVGVLMVGTGGNAALPYFLGMVALLVVAGAYAALVPKFPLAGSAYNYVSKGLNPHVGFLTGWVLILDYVLFPAVGVYLSAVYINQLLPWVPVTAAALSLVAINVVLNIVGIDLLAKFGLWMLAFVSIIWLIIVVGWIQYLVSTYGFGSLFSFKNALYFSSGAALTSMVALTLVNIVGFDALTTLVEEANHPHKDVPRAMYMTVAGGCLFFILSGYFCSVVIAKSNGPNYLDKPGDWVNVPFHEAAVTAQGTWLATLITVGLAVSVGLVFCSLAIAAASRLLYGMGRDRLLPKPIFGAINKRFQTPHWNILFIASVTVAIALFVDINKIFNYINFGAITAFAMVQITAIWVYVVKRNPGDGGLRFYLRYLLWPLAGFGILVWLFTGIATQGKLFGLGFLALGAVWLAVSTRGFRQLPPELEL